MNKEKLIELFEHYIKGTASPLQKAELLNWIRNNRALDGWMAQDVDAAEDQLDPQISREMLEKIYREILPADKKRPLLQSRILKYAALFLMPLVTAACIYVVMHMRNEMLYSKSAEMMSEIVVERGQKAQIALPDGTKVWLNSDTKLTYPGSFNVRDRKVRLSGEAYFEVQKDEERPFEIIASELKVRVLGTEFNIRAYDNDRYITSTLIRGKIEASTPNGVYIQQPNESIIYDKTAQSTRKMEVDDAGDSASWRLNELHFDNKRLDDIALELQRLYNIDVVIEDENLKSLRFTGSMSRGNTSLEMVLQFISISAQISYSFEGDKVIIRN